jgi:hypothetical protein
VVREHVGHAGRRVPWRQIAGGSVLCAALLLAGASRADSANELLPLVRVASLTLAATAVFALHDPASPVTEATPPGRWHLRSTAAALTFVVVTSAWAALVSLSDAFTASSLRPLAAGSSVELLAMFTTGLAIGATTQRATSFRIAPAWAAAALVLAFAATLTNVRLRAWLWVEPGPQWQRAHVHWLALAAVGFVAFAWSSRDPARQPMRHGVNRPSRPARQNHDDVSA